MAAQMAHWWAARKGFHSAGRSADLMGENSVAHWEVMSGMK